jgi:hypothetical protein
MWIKTDYEGTLEELKCEVENAIRQFEEDRKAGKIKPVNEDKEFWL